MDEFMELIGQASQLATTLKTKITKENEREKVNDAKSEELSNRETVANDKDSDLNQREAAVKKIESVVQLKADAVELQKKAEKTMAEAKAEKEKNDLESNAAKDKLTADRKALADAEAKHLDDLKSLKTGWEQLRKKEKTYKDEINAKLQNLNI